jgi:hypothetical protein
MKMPIKTVEEQKQRLAMRIIQVLRNERELPDLWLGQIVERKCDVLQCLPKSEAVCTSHSRASPLEPQCYTTAQTLLLRLGWDKFDNGRQKGAQQILISIN